MLVIVTNKQVLSVNQVCPGCLMANHGGEPRWHHGKLGCGHALNSGQSQDGQAKMYQCQMGFRVTEVE
ncbi:hypothetical protein Xen7305DRAFT_00038510 [Xenococcus sp. PCC 7305]|uniref:hypothetical protein n=1 Tax=Xenococcus sp. PCC 7305 TaxID=102125 RepID=UPI0002ABC0C7|nr:hypothetical protein [Xenococcus sp. PCC 7305]ELS04123.1 hypothetical protein Xen7305DRAFT_00038510 [Xenococcus sp. PCC 7305]